jgi:hypothetical protein
MDDESFMIIDYFENKIWKNKKGKFHRLDGPAIESICNTKEWYKNGLRHRLDGPAIEYASGSKFWYQNGKLHREDGPAVVYNDGEKEWWLNNLLQKTKEEYFDNLSDEAKARYLFSEDFLNG